MPRTRKTTSSPKVAALRDLRDYSKEYGPTQAAKWAGLPVSTLNSWLDRRSLTAKQTERAQSSLKSLRKEERGYKRDLRDISKQFRNIEKLNNLPQLAKSTNHQSRTIEKWRSDLKEKPSPALVKRIKQGFTKADNNATLIESKNKVRRDKQGNITTTIGREETWDAVRPPKQADRYRIVGVDRNGNVTWSTIAGDDYDDVVEDADTVQDQYDTQAVYIILTYLN